MLVNMLGFDEKPDRDALDTLEKETLDRAIKWQTAGTAYAQEHGTRPSTIGNVLSSSPLALLAWYDTSSRLQLTQTKFSQDWREIP